MNCFLFFKNGGKFKCTPDGNWSCIVYPLAAKVRSPGANLWRMLQCLTIAISDVEPGYSTELYVITPFGATPVTALTVCRDLYELYVACMSASAGQVAHLEVSQRHLPKLEHL